MSAPIKYGDYVVVTEGPHAGRKGFVQRVHRANTFHPRRAEVFMGAGWGTQIVRMDWLKPAEEPES
jgi:hypothetical protein